jgi:hypothetical protein
MVTFLVGRMTISFAHLCAKVVVILVCSKMLPTYVPLFSDLSDNLMCKMTKNQGIRKQKKTMNLVAPQLQISR